MRHIILSFLLLVGCAGASYQGETTPHNESTEPTEENDISPVAWVIVGLILAEGVVFVGEMGREAVSNR